MAKGEATFINLYWPPHTHTADTVTIKCTFSSLLCSLFSASALGNYSISALYAFLQKENPTKAHKSTASSLPYLFLYLATSFFVLSSFRVCLWVDRLILTVKKVTVVVVSLFCQLRFLYCFIFNCLTVCSEQIFLTDCFASNLCFSALHKSAHPFQFILYFVSNIINIPFGGKSPTFIIITFGYLWLLFAS